ncbi:MAG TPA: hypothetical protein VHY18_12740 [Solirubrobacteraceae bacterium]|nr:hypothetical protein [Solirubrobacteraceae bacterium]
MAQRPCLATDLRRVHADVAPATLARAIAVLTERGLLLREDNTLTLASTESLDVLSLANQSPGGLSTLRVLANPLARAILEQLLSGRKPRRELSSLGPPPRVSDALKDLELLGALQRDQQLVLLIDPAIHRQILDLVDEILAREHRREYLRARSRLRARANTSRDVARTNVQNV